MSRMNTAHADQWRSEADTGIFRPESSVGDDHVLYEIREGYLARAKQLRYDMAPLPANRVTLWAHQMRRRNRAAWLAQLGRDVTLGTLFYCSIFVWFSYQKPGTYEEKAFSMSISTAQAVASRVSTLLKPRRQQFEVIYGK